jgi:hypothetical protein
MNLPINRFQGFAIAGMETVAIKELVFSVRALPIPEL